MKVGLHSLNSRGFTLVGVLMVLIVLSVLGLGITTVASNSLKISTGERDDQSVYYIAEAGLTEVRAQINDLAIKSFNDVDKQYQEIIKPEQKESFLIEKSFENRFLESARNEIGTYISTNQPNVEIEYERQFEGNGKPTATVSLIPKENEDNTYIITSVGNIDGKTRTISQLVVVAFGHDLETDVISQNGSGSTESGVFKACANGYFNSATTSGTVKVEGDIILKKDSTLSLGGEDGGIGGNIYSYGNNLSITNSAPIGGGVYSNGSVNITNATTIGRDLFALGDIKVSNSATVKGSVHSNGTVEISNSMKIDNNLLALGNITFTGYPTIKGNVFSDSIIDISTHPEITGQLYATKKIKITGQPKVSGDIVSKGGITISNGQVKANEILSSENVNTNGNKYNNVRQNVSIEELPKPVNGFNGLNKLVDVSELYNDIDCTDLDDEKFKPVIPDAKFRKDSTNLPGGSESIEFTDSNNELHFDVFNYNKYDKVNIKLPKSSEEAVYSLYFNTLNMNNRDIHIEGNGKLNIYVKDSLSLGKIIQDKDSNGNKRSNFDTTIYDLNDKKTPPILSNWSNCKIEANIYVKDANLTNSGCPIYGNIVVLGENTVTLAGDNKTNGQIFYLPDSKFVASGSVDIKGAIVTKDMTGSGNIKISNSGQGDGYINTDIFDKPSSSTEHEIKNYKAKTLLLTKQQIEQ
ncbi:PilX N-terminal domain-containing pilus assembly protein [Sporosarcina sp. CAU 1771]